MYACNLETGRGFFEGVSAPSDATTHLRDPPLPLDTRIDYESSPLASLHRTRQWLANLFALRSTLGT
jgi:hypothetical protein